MSGPGRDACPLSHSQYRGDNSYREPCHAENANVPDVIRYPSFSAQQYEENSIMGHEIHGELIVALPFLLD